MKVAVAGAGAFGTALAISICATGPVTLWLRDAGEAEKLSATRENARRLPGARLPDSIRVSSDAQSLSVADVVLLAVPMQKLRGFLQDHRAQLAGRTLVACCKGIELDTGQGPQDVIADVLPDASLALLTGPAFARDIAIGLPTAMTLACADPTLGGVLQERLSSVTLRLYRSTDVTGAALGGALKNVVAIACGAAIGAGLGESARAALMTRGNAEMTRLAARRGADPATLSGLSGFGDLVLTCTSEQSRNYRLGLSLGQGTGFDPAVTVEGAATARAMDAAARSAGDDMPITAVVAALVENRLDVPQAMRRLLSRSLKEE